MLAGTLAWWTTLANMSELFGSTAALQGAHLTWKIDKMLQHALQKVIINVECRPLLAHSLLVHLPVTNHDDALSRAEGATGLGEQRQAQCCYASSSKESATESCRPQAPIATQPTASLTQQQVAKVQPCTARSHSHHIATSMVQRAQAGPSLPD